MRIVSFCMLIVLGFMSPLWVFVPFAVLYVMVFRGYELIALAFFIDAQFGTPGTYLSILYTVIIGALIIAGVWIRPHLRFYDSERYESV